MRGEVARLRGEPHAALEFFDSLDEDAEPLVSSLRGAALVALGNRDGARAAYERALERDPDDVVALRGLGEIELERGADEGIARAETWLRRAIDLDPDSALAHALLAEVLRRTDRLGEAVAAFDRALSLRPRYSYALASKGQTLIELGDRDAGVAVMREAVREAPAKTWILDELVKELEADSYDEVDNILCAAQRDIRDRGGNLLPVLVHRARLARKHRRMTEAERLFRKARELAPAERDLAYEHVDVLGELGRLEEALAVLDDLPRPVGEVSELDWKRMDILWRLQRWPEIRSELARLPVGDLVRSEQLPTLAWAALGELYRMEGRRPEARQLLKKAQEQEENHAYTLASLGALETCEGNLSAARSYLKRATELQHGYPFALTTLIRLELEDGRTDRVAELLDDLRDADPADRELARVRAMGLYGLGNYSSARDVLEACLVEAGDDASVLRARGWVEIGLGQSRAAARSFCTAAELPDTPLALVDTAITLTRVDLWDEALHLAARARESGNPFADTALVVVWLQAGAWAAAEQRSISGLERTPQHQVSALYAASSLRLAGKPHDAVRTAQDAFDRWPNDWDIMAELGECLLEAGDRDKATATFEDLLARSRRLARPDADYLQVQGRCLLRLGRTQEAAHVFLRALSPTDQTARVLLNMILVSLLDDDQPQVVALVNRFWEELDLLSSPTRRGVIALAIHDLATVDAQLPTGVRSEAGSLDAELGSRQTQLDPKLAEASGRLLLGW